MPELTHLKRNLQYEVYRSRKLLDQGEEYYGKSLDKLKEKSNSLHQNIENDIKVIQQMHQLAYLQNTIIK